MSDDNAPKARQHLDSDTALMEAYRKLAVIEQVQADARVGPAVRRVAPFAVEFLGCAALTAALGASGNPLAPAAMLVGLSYTGKHVTGAHLNPAVTVVALWRAQIRAANAVGFVVVQLLGALLGSGLADLITAGAVARPVAAAGCGAGCVVGAEAAGAALFVFVLLGLHAAADSPGFFGLAAGGALLGGMSLAAPVSGGALNPAVSTALALAHADGTASLWAYWVGPLAGAVAGAALSWAARLQGSERQSLARTLAVAAPLVTEAVGTCAVALVAALSGQSLPVGATVMALTFAARPAGLPPTFSPAGALAFLLRGTLTTTRVVLAAATAAAQFVGAFVAAFLVSRLAHPGLLDELRWWVVSHVTDDSSSAAGGGTSAVMRCAVAEVTFSAIVLVVALNAFAASGAEGGGTSSAVLPQHGAAIGFSVVGAWAAAAAATGAVYNPAVAATLHILGLRAAELGWALYLGPLCGAVLAVGLFVLTNPVQYVVAAIQEEDDDLDELEV